MSHELPNVGDRAEVVLHPCCGKHLRYQLTVTKVLWPRPPGETGLISLTCDICDYVHIMPTVTMCLDEVGATMKRPCFFPRHWLRKLPPLCEPVVEEQHNRAPVYDPPPEIFNCRCTLEPQIERTG